jgi:hypothetical protein
MRKYNFSTSYRKSNWSFNYHQLYVNIDQSRANISALVPWRTFFSVIPGVKEEIDLALNYVKKRWCIAYSRKNEALKIISKLNQVYLFRYEKVVSQRQLIKDCIYILFNLIENNSLYKKYFCSSMPRISFWDTYIFLWHNKTSSRTSPWFALEMKSSWCRLIKLIIIYSTISIRW